MRYAELRLRKQAEDGQAAWAQGRNAQLAAEARQQQEMYNTPQAELHRLSKASDTPIDVRRRVLAERKRRMQGGVYGEALQQARNTAPEQLNPTAFGAGDKVNGTAKTNAAAQVRREQAGIPQQASSGWASWQPYKAALEELGPASYFKALPAGPVAVMRTLGKIPGAMYKLPAYTSELAGKVIPGAVAALMYGHDAETAKAAWQGATENYDNSLLGMAMQNMHGNGNALDNRITAPMRYPSYLENTPGYSATMNAVEDMGAAMGAHKLVSGAPGMARDAIDASKAKLAPVARNWLQRLGAVNDKVVRPFKQRAATGRLLDLADKEAVRYDSPMPGLTLEEMKTTLPDYIDWRAGRRPWWSRVIQSDDAFKAGLRRQLTSRQKLLDAVRNDTRQTIKPTLGGGWEWSQHLDDTALDSAPEIVNKMYSHQYSSAVNKLRLLRAYEEYAKNPSKFNQVRVKDLASVLEQNPGAEYLFKGMHYVDNKDTLSSILDRSSNKGALFFSPRGEVSVGYGKGGTLHVVQLPEEMKEQIKALYTPHAMNASMTPELAAQLRQQAASKAFELSKTHAGIGKSPVYEAALPYDMAKKMLETTPFKASYQVLKTPDLTNALNTYVDASTPMPMDLFRQVKLAPANPWREVLHSSVDGWKHMKPMWSPPGLDKVPVAR